MSLRPCSKESAGSGGMKRAGGAVGKDGGEKRLFRLAWEPGVEAHLSP